MSDLTLLHSQVIRYLDIATNGMSGRPENDHIYQAITEGRDVGAARKGYSSCGDLCHWLLYRMGVRLDWVNREENGLWKPGRNISRLVYGPSARSPVVGEKYQPGDILCIWDKEDSSDAHVFVVWEHHDDKVVSADYGQPGGSMRMRGLDWRTRTLGGKRLRRVLPLLDVLIEAEKAGALVAPEDPGEWLVGKNVEATV